MITIKTDDEGGLRYPLTADGWQRMIDWDERYGYQSGCLVMDEVRHEWDDSFEQYPDCLRAALVCAVDGLLSTKEFVDDKHACDDPYSVLDQIPETLRMRSILGETPRSFVELVRWASHDVR